jgi:FkbM family methyltransferase
MSPTYSYSWSRRLLRKIGHWLGYQYQSLRRPILTLEGVRVRLGPHLSPKVERAIARGAYERDELRVLAAILSPADVVLDIGAGLGMVSAYCAKRIGSKRVFAFEANPDLEPRILETYALNGVNPTLEMCAVGPHAGRVTLYRGKHLFSSSLISTATVTRPIEVPGKALSYLVDRLRPTLLVIDVKGAEVDLFDGARLPGVSKIVLELHQRIIGNDGVNRVRATLAKLGFKEDLRFSSGERLVLVRESRVNSLESKV